MGENRLIVIVDEINSAKLAEELIEVAKNNGLANPASEGNPALRLEYIFQHTLLDSASGKTQVEIVFLKEVGAAIVDQFESVIQVHEPTLTPFQEQKENLEGFLRDYNGINISDLDSDNERILLKILLFRNGLTDIYGNIQGDL